MSCELTTSEVEFIDKTIADLKDENERLREQLESIVSRSFRTADKMACLESENAKLREKLLEAYRSERKLMMDNAKLRLAFNETRARLIAANETTEANYMDEDYCDLLRELGVDE